MKLTQKQDAIAKPYSKLAAQKRKYPSRADLIKAGISWDAVRAAFGDMTTLKELARQAYPEKFDDVIDPDHFAAGVFDDLRREVKNYKRFVITTAVAGAPVDEDFLASIKTYCKKKKAMLLILPANYALYDMDPELVKNEHIVFKDLKLCSNLMVSAIKIDPKQVDPVLGLDDLSNRECTVIIGSPKQRCAPIANSNAKLAKFIQGTGAITKPRYVPRDGTPKRRDALATLQHVMGAIVVEVVGNKTYHFREIEALKDGSFNDLFVNYSPEGAKPAPVEAIIQGDFHNGHTDPGADACADELCALGKPKYRVLHDLFDGESINHHERKNQVKRAMTAAQPGNKLSLETELRELKLTLEKKIALGTAQQLVVVKSNHDEFLIRYLADGNFDDHNRVISAKLQVLAMEGKDPLQAGLEELFGLKAQGKIQWLNRDQDFRLGAWKVESGTHGDLGAHGSRNPGSRGMYKYYGKVTYGHCHYREINHGAKSVGTSSYLKLSYNRGPNAWSHTHCIQYADGSRQLINSINGEWRLKD
jgi:hypothetical protein